MHPKFLTRSMARAILAVALGASTALAVEPAGHDLARRIDEILSSIFPADEPGGAVLVARNGKVIFRRGYGLANVEHGVPNTPDTVFRLYSQTKQFTAVAILQLLEAGELSLEDEITLFLPDYPTHGSRITIRHLLGHQSGIFDYGGIPKIREGLRDEITLHELIDLFKDKPLRFEPGTQMAYSNSNYILLGAIIERLSGRSYDDYLTERVLKPAGMTSTLCDEHTRLIPNRAAGYEPDGDGFRNARFINMTESHAAGALVSSVDDMFRWDQALYEGKLVKPATLELAFSPLKLDDGSETDSACGWGISQLRGQKALIHGGHFFGFHSYGLTIPKDRVYVILLANSHGRDPGASNLVAQLAALALGEPYDRRPAVNLTPEQLDGLTGAYANAVDPGSVVRGGIRRIVREGQHLVLHGAHGGAYRLVMVSMDEAYVERRFPTRLMFTLDEAGRATQFLLDWPLGPPQACVRTP